MGGARTKKKKREDEDMMMRRRGSGHLFLQHVVDSRNRSFPAPKKGPEKKWRGDLCFRQGNFAGDSGKKVNLYLLRQQKGQKPLLLSNCPLDRSSPPLWSSSGQKINFSHAAAFFASATGCYHYFFPSAV